MTRISRFGLLLAAGLLAAASTADAQTMNASAGSYNAGYGRSSDQENQPVNVQLSDANGNMTVENGIIRNTAAGSVFASAGVETNYSGAGGTASAIGNNLSVVTEGNYNTVIVNSTQTNTGAVTATTSINGKP